MNRDDFVAELKRVAPAIESALDQLALPEGAPVAELREGVRYALGLDVADAAKRGKRLRPVLALLTCEALGGSTAQVMPFAVAVELMHNFFLVHDDIEDGDEVRHGRPAAWKRFGLAEAINIGDYLHARVPAVVLRSADLGVAPPTVLRLLALLVETLEHTHCGQALDIAARSSADITMKQYMEMVREKTGHYLAAPLIGGAIVAGADQATVDRVREYGTAIGPMFQIVDDLVDLTESKGRGERGADIREGKRSFLVAFALAAVDGPTRGELLGILDRPREATTPQEVARAIEIFETSGAIEQARAAVSELGRQAREAAERMPDRLCRLLTAAADFFETRTR